MKRLGKTMSALMSCSRSGGKGKSGTGKVRNDRREEHQAERDPLRISSDRMKRPARKAVGRVWN
jgi:hypothetical protein